jgi:hypothetical protein
MAFQKGDFFSVFLGAVESGSWSWSFGFAVSAYSVKPADSKALMKQ